MEHKLLEPERRRAQEMRNSGRPLCVGCGMEVLYGRSTAALSVDECDFLNGVGCVTDSSETFAKMSAEERAAFDGLEKGSGIFEPGDLYCHWCWISYSTEPWDLQPDARA